MIYELRVYTCQPGKMPAAIERLRAAASVYFPRHAIRVVKYWSVLIGENNHELHYVIEWDSMSAREERWTAFVTDPEFVALRAASEVDGPLLTSIRNAFLTPMDLGPTLA